MHLRISSQLLFIYQYRHRQYLKLPRNAIYLAHLVIPIAIIAIFSNLCLTWGHTFISQASIAVNTVAIARNTIFDTRRTYVQDILYACITWYLPSVVSSTLPSALVIWSGRLSDPVVVTVSDVLDKSQSGNYKIINLITVNSANILSSQSRISMTFIVLFKVAIPGLPLLESG